MVDVELQRLKYHKWRALAGQNKRRTSPVSNVQIWRVDRSQSWN
jgi:hypothetical protein